MMLPRILPFACYMFFIAVRSFFSTDVSLDGSSASLWLYPIQVSFVAALLFFYRKDYIELKEKVFANTGEVILTVAVGFFVYLAWVRMDFSWAMQGEAGEGYNPKRAGMGMGIFFAGVRLLGASLIVPLMEELFWRSFIIRYIISPDFRLVPLGKFTRASFLITTILFGVEHHLWLAGIMAGIAYNLLLYRTGRLWPCIVAHSVTNFMLGIHVLSTEEWFWW